MPSPTYIPFNQVSRSVFRGLEAAYETGILHISGDGPSTKQCEDLLQKELGSGSVLLTTSCTSALEMAALLIRNPAKPEVILPSFTFVSTANAFLLHGFTPRFADINPQTLNIEVAAIEKLINDRTSAICVVHYAGVACEMNEIRSLCLKHNLFLIEDNAHGLFGKFEDSYLGTIGDLATLSFHETKNFTSGEGGALIINRPELQERAHILREKGTNRRRFKDGLVDKYTWLDVGSSWVMSDLLARLLLPQLQHHQQITRRRREIFDFYMANLAAIQDHGLARLPSVPDYAFHPGHLFYLILESRQQRSDFIDHLSRDGINVVFHYQALNTSPMGLAVGGRAGECPVTESIAERLVRLPVYCDLSSEDLERIVTSSLNFFDLR